jgi:hypothetical protein
MRWCRYHQRVVGILALFALGFQLAVSFAHLHLDGIRPASGVSLSGTASTGRLPAGVPDSPGTPHNDCAICVAIGLLNNALNGDPPAVSLPAAICFALLGPVSETRFSVARFYPFRTRAPPVA